MTIGIRIKNARKLNKITQDKLAELISVSRVTISSWENNENAPTVDNIIYLPEVLRVSTDYLLKGAMEPGAQKPAEIAAPIQDDIFLSLFQTLGPAERDEVIKYMRYQEFLSKVK